MGKEGSKVAHADKPEGGRISQAAVIGAGVMGSGIAAHLANAGVPVLLLDIVPPDADNRNILAETALKKLNKADPAAFMHKKNARLVTPGNLEDDLEKVADADWIVEAVIERLDIKQDVYAKLEGVRKSGSIVSSNTSTIPLHDLVEGLPETFARDFLITHFFNPPRYMRLLEIVAGDQTDPEILRAMMDFADLRLGKGVVKCKDTPGFVANRIGSFWMQAALSEALDAGMGVEEADAVLGRPAGAPKTGVFGLVDLVGLDLIPEVGKSMLARLPQDDPYREVHRDADIVTQLIESGYTGRKGKGGFYRLNREGGGKVKEVVDLETGEFSPVRRITPEAAKTAKSYGLRGLVQHPDDSGRYAWQVLSKTLSYAASLVPEIAGTVAAVDEAIKLGYNWKQGPFEMLDELGPAWFAEKLREEGRPVPELLEEVGEDTFYRVRDGVLEYREVGGGYEPVPRRPGVLLLEDVKRAGEPLASNSSASLWDVGDGIVCLEFHSRSNALDRGTLAMVKKATKVVKDGYQGLVIHNEGTNFSVGANIGVGLFAANMALWQVVEEEVQMGHEAYKALKHAPFPVVGAPAGMALGGGCEILLHSDAVQAAAETYMGLPETGLGLVPAWGGCKEMLLRHIKNEKRYQGPMPPVMQVFETVGMATVSKSAAEAKSLLFLRGSDGITMNRDRLLADAKARALELSEGYSPPEMESLSLPGPTGAAAIELAVQDYRKSGRATPHDAVVAGYLARVLSGGDTDLTETVTEDDIRALEREAFTTLIKHPDTLARVEHMLETGKPLRN